MGVFVPQLTSQEHQSTTIQDIRIDCDRVGQRLKVRLTNLGCATIVYRTSRKYAEPGPEDIDVFVWSGGYDVYPMRISGTFWCFGQESLQPGASVETTLWDANRNLRELESGVPYFLGVSLVRGEGTEIAWTGRSGWPLLSDKELLRKLALDFKKPESASYRLRTEGVSETRILALLRNEGKIPIKQALKYTQLPPESKKFYSELSE